MPASKSSTFSWLLIKMTGEGTPVPVHFNICNGGERKLIDGFVVKEDYLSSSPRRTPLCPH